MPLSNFASVRNRRLDPLSALKNLRRDSVYFFIRTLFELDDSHHSRTCYNLQFPKPIDPRLNKSNHEIFSNQLYDICRETNSSPSTGRINTPSLEKFVSQRTPRTN